MANPSESLQQPSNWAVLVRQNRWLLIICVVAVYVATALATEAIFAFQPAASIVRPPAGIALAAVLLFGYQALPAITIGAFLAHWIILQHVGAALGLGVAETLQAGFAFWILQQAGFDSRLQRVRDVVTYVVFAAILSNFLGAIIGPTTQCLTGVIDGDLLAKASIAWWFGNAIAVLTITPLLLTWPLRRLDRNQYGEALILSVLLVLACQIAFGRWLGLNETSYPLAFVPFPFVMWAALRFGVFGSSVAIVFTTIAGVFGVLQASEPISESAFQPILIQYAFSGAICVTALLAAAAQSERRRADRKRQQRDREFRSLLSAIPDALIVFDAQGQYRHVFTANQDLLIDKRENMIGKSLQEVLPSEPAEIGMKIIRQVLESRELTSISYSLDIRGQTRRFSARAVPYGVPSDPCVLWVARDVTDLHHTQSELQASEKLMRNLLELQEEERKVLAYNIHDGLVQYMVGAQMSLDGISLNLTAEQASTVEKNLAWCRELIGNSIDEARQLISELRPLIIDESGIVEAIGYLINDQLRDDVEIRFVPTIDDDRLPPLLKATVFRIVQEALSNVRKHSGAKHVQITLLQDAEHLNLTIEDDGTGFDLEDPSRNRFGVESIIKRAALFGGQAAFETAPGNGTKVDVILPLHLPTEDDATEVTAAATPSANIHNPDNSEPRPSSTSEIISK